MPGISIHAVDVARGVVAVGMRVEVFAVSAECDRRLIARGAISAAGTLEQLAMNRYGLVSVLLADFSAQATVNTAVLGLVIVPMMATTGQWLHFDALTVVPLMLLTMGSVVGLGLAVGGCALVFKRINGLAGVLQFGFPYPPLSLLLSWAGYAASAAAAKVKLVPGADCRYDTSRESNATESESDAGHYSSDLTDASYLGPFVHLLFLRKYVCYVGGI